MSVFLAQSDNANGVKRTLHVHCEIPAYDHAWRTFQREPNVPVWRAPTNSRDAMPISCGESSCRKWSPLTVTSRWFGQLRQKSRVRPVMMAPGLPRMRSLGVVLLEIQVL